MNNIIQAAREMGVNVQWAIGRRKAYLAEQAAKKQAEAEEALKRLAGSNELERHLVLNILKDTTKKTMSGRKGRITQEQINRARKYSIEKIVITPVKGRKTNCVNHDDKNASMDIRNNFAYCYSCGWLGDSIAVYMKIYNASFVEAVSKLS